MTRLPFNKASLSGKEIDYIIQAVEGGHISGDGEFTRRCHHEIESLLGARKALLTTSCTHALEMSALLLEAQPGDEVVVPSYTFVSTVNAFALRGARPVFVDIRRDTLNMDESQVERLITPRTRAVVPVHYAGVGCEMETICDVARRRRISVVEDNAHGFLGTYRNENLGTFGELATLSFHETKNFTCGEGGALLMNDEDLVERAEILREKGTNRSRFFRGEVDKYTWVDIGSSYLPSDILAAFLLAQLEDAERVQARRRRIWELYFERLGDWAAKEGVGLPVVPDHCGQSYHMFYMICPTPKKRDLLIGELREREILSVFHYVPLHLSPMGRRWGYRQGDLPITEDVSLRLLRLPFFSSLEESDMQRICDSIFEISRTW